MQDEAEEHKSSGGLDSMMVASGVLRAMVPNYIRVKICWHTVTSSDQPDWLFRDQKRISRSLSERIKGPRIYRFLFNVEQTPSCYIGQSGHFEDRVGDYRRELRALRSAYLNAFTLEGLTEKAKKLHSYSTTRVGALIQLAEQEGSKVELQLIDFPEFSFNKNEITLGSLSDPFRRLAMENLAVLDAESSPLMVLNRGINEVFFTRKLRENTKRMAAANAVALKRSLGDMRMNAIGQRKIDLVPLLQLGLEEVLLRQRFYEFPRGLRVEADLGEGWCWKIVDPARSEVIGSFCLDPAQMIDLAKKGALDDRTLSVISNALMNYAAVQPEKPQE